MVEELEQVPDARLPAAHAEVLGRDILDRVRLVEDHVVVVREDPPTAHAQREVTEVERVVADENLRVLHASARGLEEALLVGRALATHAVA